MAKAKKVTSEIEKDASTIISTIQRFGRPLDAPELQQATKINFSRVNAALDYAKTLGVVEVKTEGELLPRYGFDMFASAPKKARPAARAATPKSKPAPKVAKVNTKKPAAKPAKKPKTQKTAPAVGSKGYEIVKIIMTRCRDIATGRLMPACSDPRKDEWMYTNDGIKAKVRYSCDDTTGEATRLSVLSYSLPKTFRDDIKTIPPEAKSQFLSSLREVIQEELQRELEKDRWANASRQDLNKERGQRAAQEKQKKAAARVAKGLPAKTAPDKARAANELEALRARMGALNAKINKTKSAKQLAQLTKRRSRWQKAKTQLEKIVMGKASVFPKPSELR